MQKMIGSIKLPIDRLHVELTNVCNFSCEFCPDAKMNRPRGMMPLKTVYSIIDEISGANIVKTMMFHVMGEPTLYPHLLEVVKYAATKNVKTCLTTNGARLDDNLLEALVQSGLDMLIISLQTPDAKTFELRGAKGIGFDEYADKIVSAARLFIRSKTNSRLTISFLSSPLRRLIIPIFSEVSIADTSSDLKSYLKKWAGRINEAVSCCLDIDAVSEQIDRISSIRENTVHISDNVVFHTRVMGDWAIHFDKKNVNAVFGFCPGLQDNFGILCNGDYTFCCTDFDGNTTTANFFQTPIIKYLASPTVQNVVRNFNRFKVAHPYCKQCLGDRNILNSMVKQMGSIIYFKFLRKNSQQQEKER